MSRAALNQKLLDLLLVVSVVMLTACSADPLVPDDGEVIRATQGAQAQAQREEDEPRVRKISKDRQ